MIVVSLLSRFITYLMGILILGNIINGGIESLAAEIDLTAVIKIVVYMSVRTGCLTS